MSESHTTFYVDYDVFCFKAMPFKLQALQEFLGTKHGLPVWHVGKILQMQTTCILPPRNLRMHAPTQCSPQYVKMHFPGEIGKILRIHGEWMWNQGQPIKMKVIEEMKSLNVQCMNNQLPSLKLFISNVNDRALPFFQILREKKRF